jgi:hypothetical protein
MITLKVSVLNILIKKEDRKIGYVVYKINTLFLIIYFINIH